ncbi:hypothetical protein L9F63_007540, partial [Diploptera punctata]
MILYIVVRRADGKCQTWADVGMVSSARQIHRCPNAEHLHLYYLHSTLLYHTKAFSAL